LEKLFQLAHLDRTFWLAFRQVVPSHSRFADAAAWS
jgi:hypothetical protein